MICRINTILHNSIKSNFLKVCLRGFFVSVCYELLDICCWDGFNHKQTDLAGIVIITSSCYRQLSAYIKIKNHKIKTSFVSTIGLQAATNKTGINFMTFILFIWFRSHY